jgi:hypothetical protein
MTQQSLTTYKSAPELVRIHEQSMALLNATKSKLNTTNITHAKQLAGLISEFVLPLLEHQSHMAVGIQADVAGYAEMLFALAFSSRRLLISYPTSTGTSLRPPRPPSIKRSWRSMS